MDKEHLNFNLVRFGFMQYMALVLIPTIVKFILFILHKEHQSLPHYVLEMVLFMMLFFHLLFFLLKFLIYNFHFQ